MLQAQLRGKLSRNLENMEDLLTSNVFGSIKYLSPENGLIPILINSEDIDGNAPKIDLQNVREVNYFFWPWVNEPGCCGCEPDVRITIKYANDSKVLFDRSKLSNKSHNDRRQ